MKTNNLFGLVLLSLFFFSCKKDISNQNPTTSNSAKEENGRLVFDSHESFYAFVDDLDNGKAEVNSSFSSLQKAFDKASQSEDESTVSPEIKDLQSFNFPPSFTRILNKKGEVKIDNDIIWYHSGKKYFIPVSDESELERRKLNPENISKVSNAGSKIAPLTLKNISLKDVSNRTYLPTNGALDARHQHEFNQVYPPTGGPRKYVHEIITYGEGYWLPNNVYIWFTQINLRIKMEWKNSNGKWRPAGETRDLTVNISGNATLRNAGTGGYEFGPTISHNNSTQVNSDYYVGLAKYNGSGIPPAQDWQLDLWGTIYQHVVGDLTSNAWYNTGTSTSPLW